MRSKRGFEEGGQLLSLTTRNEYLTSIKGFTRWAKKRHKVECDPLDPLSKGDEDKEEKRHPRRALTVEQVSALLDAALRRPEHELTIIRTGKNKGTIGAKVHPRVLAKARKTGIERRIAYLLAIWTGLRRSELAQLEWQDISLDAESPFIQLRATTTKSSRADMIALHPQVVEELRQYRRSNAKPHDCIVSRIPSMNVMKADLAFAGIDYCDQRNGFADLHAQRKTLNLMLAVQRVPSRVRQSQLRHTDPRLTEDTYWDKQNFLKPQMDEVSKAAAIPITVGSNPQTPPLHPAQLVHNGDGSEGHLGSLAGTQQGRDRRGSKRGTSPESASKSPDSVAKRHDPASGDTGSFGQRVKGVEPSTFTLATLWDDESKPIAGSVVTTHAESPLTISTQRPRPSALSDADLDELAKSWHQLPDTLKQALVSLVRASTEQT
jgi:integrase